MDFIKERPRLRQGILSYCEKNGITIIDMYAYPCSSSIKKQLKLMLIEQDQLHAAELQKIQKWRS